MKKFYFFILSIVVLALACTTIQNDPEITAKEIKEHIKYLASDEMKGRYTGSPEAKLAAEYLAKEYKSYGLKPLFKDDFFQYYNFISSLSLGENSLEIDLNKARIQPEIKKEFIPTPFSGNIKYQGDMVMVGYGISAPDLKYDDYEGIDVKGKAVIVLRYHPDHKNPHSDFEKYAAYRYKAKIARDKGASAIIFVNGFFPKDEEDKLMNLRYDGAVGMDDIGAIQIKRNIIKGILEAENVDLKEYQQMIDSTQKPNSFKLKFSTIKNLTTSVSPVNGQGINVAALLEGSDNKLKDEYIVIGAHYDHLGYGETGSLYRGEEKQIHNGADDNASGTAGVIELAEKFASIKDKIKRSIIFVNFSGEELGLLGSDYFVKNLPVPAEKIVAMINLDMVGRLDTAKALTVYGVGTSSVWKELLKEGNKPYNFKLNEVDDGYGPSDQTSFYGKNIPVLFFFTGIHKDYHRPTDDADLINGEGEESILKLVENVTENLANKESKPDYVNVPRKDGGRTMGFRVYVGTIPDYSSQEKGFKINGVNEGSPAQKGGIQAGDIMTSFGGKKIENIYDYTYALGEFNPGDVVDVVVMRNGKEVKLKVELGAR
ncbi:MAG TPA: M28 family peptidase [Ignavibacteriaceae bacterium]|nr:M28 family peptidase [Ignavibacteriaceae bacterium]